MTMVTAIAAVVMTMGEQICHSVFLYILSSNLPKVKFAFHPSGAVVVGEIGEIRYQSSTGEWRGGGCGQI